MSGARVRRAVPLALALVVIALTLPLAWMGATPIEASCFDTIPSDERGEEETTTSLWPPGVRCTSVLPGGREFEATYITWYEMSTAFLTAAGAWLVSAAILSVIPLRTFGFGLVAVCVAFVVASAAFFV